MKVELQKLTGTGYDKDLAVERLDRMIERNDDKTSLEEFYDVCMHSDVDASPEDCVYCHNYQYILNLHKVGDLDIYRMFNEVFIVTGLSLKGSDKLKDILSNIDKNPNTQRANIYVMAVNHDTCDLIISANMLTFIHILPNIIISTRDKEVKKLLRAMASYLINEYPHTCLEWGELLCD